MTTPQDISKLLDLLGLAEERQLFEAQCDALNSAPPRVEILVMGEFNHGKSSLINMLAGRKVLKVGLTPTTQVETTIGFGAAADRVLVHEKGNVVHEVPLEALQQDTMPNCSHIEIELSEGRLPREALIIDTPGLNEAHALRETFVETLIERASLILFLLDASQPATRNELDQVDKFLRDLPAEKRAIVVNKCDRLDEDELTEVQAYVEKTLQPTFDAEHIFFVSAKKDGYVGNAALLNRMNEVVEARKNQVKTEATTRLIETWAERARAYAWLARAFDQDKALLAHFKPALTGTQAASRMEARLVVVRDALDKLKSSFDEHWKQFEAQFQRAILREIDKALIDDVEDYMEGFVIHEYHDETKALLNHFANSAAKAFLDALAGLSETDQKQLVSKLASTFRAPAVEYLLATELAEKVYGESDIFDELSLERLVKLPGVYKYRVDVVRKRAKTQIHNLYDVALGAFLHDCDGFLTMLKRVCMLEKADVERVWVCLVNHATSANALDGEAIVTQLESLEG